MANRPRSRLKENACRFRPGRGARRESCAQIVVNPRSGDGLAAGFGRRLACHLRTDRYDVQLISADDPARTRDELVRTGPGTWSLIAVGGVAPEEHELDLQRDTILGLSACSVLGAVSYSATSTRSRPSAFAR
jgi:hypothetical protein